MFDVRVEVPNRRVHEILRSERIAARFYAGGDRIPKVEALRKDFPIVPPTDATRDRDGTLSEHYANLTRWLRGPQSTVPRVTTPISGLHLSDAG